MYLTSKNKGMASVGTYKNILKGIFDTTDSVYLKYAGYVMLKPKHVQKAAM